MPPDRRLLPLGARVTRLTRMTRLTRLARVAVALLAAAVAVGSLAATGGPAAALDPTIPAPATRLSADGRSATDGQRTLRASVVNGLQAGQQIEVSGTGYDTFKGIYVAFCVIPPTNQTPTPCGGGADTSGVSGASHWISSNPPPQGVGVAEPYGPGGSFRVSIAVSPTIGPPGGTTVDCRRVRCAVVTRNDHTRSTDRGQDIFVPITFAAGAAAATTPPTTAPAPTTTAPPTTAPVTEPPAPSTVEPTTSTLDDGPAGTTDGSDPAEVAAETASGTGTGTGGSGAAPLVLGLGVAALVAAGVVALIVRARRSATP
jgi:hypothetical protein